MKMLTNVNIQKYFNPGEQEQNSYLKLRNLLEILWNSHK